MRRAQVTLGKQSLLRSLAEAVLGSNTASDPTTRELAGLPNFIPANSPQIVAYTAAHKRRGAFAELIARVRPGGDGLGASPDVVVTSRMAIWGLARELEDLGVTPAFAYCPLTQQPQLHYFGVPVVEGRVPETATGTLAYALCTSGPSAIRLLHCGGDEWGIVEEDVTTMPTFNPAGEAVASTSGVTVSITCALLVPDAKSLAVCTGIPLDPTT
jgi:hypothetical protein